MDDDTEWLDGLKKHYADWEKYSKNMSSFTHDFINGKCIKCTHSYTDIANGKYGWVCQIEKAGTSTEQQPNPWPQQFIYKPMEDATKEGSIFSPKQIDPKKCDCSIDVLMRKGCACGGK